MATKICLHNASVDYLKRWANVMIETDVYNTDGSVKSRSLIYPHGYFQINSDFSYNLFSDADPVDGKWAINDSCQFVLDLHTATERRFSVIQLSDDSLTIKQTLGRTTITQHYAAFKCPTLASLEYTWKNAFVLQMQYADAAPGSSPIQSAQYTYSTGYFTLNPNASYMVSSSTSPNTAPSNTITGTWGIAQTGCLLILDKNKPNERSYDVQKLTADSLVIWRKDTVAKMNYLNYYSKQK